jgi:hypothetical protein
MKQAVAGLFALLTLFACEQRAVDLRTRSLQNRAAYIPPQCFTDVSASANEPAQNPCYTCHAEAREPNMQSQPELQLSYAFPQLRAGRRVQNPWSNLFRDRREQIAAISDEAVRRYVSEDNYDLLAEKLRSLPAKWDADRNGRWDGFVPDARYRFDARGFDRGPDGTPSGYRVFAYFPLPSGFTPASGSFDDVLIRLPRAFRVDRVGALDLEVYALNLAIVEALIRRQDVPIDASDEQRYGVDLDGDGALERADFVRVTAQLKYVGQAGALLAEGKLHLAPGLFPEGTEFLHSVRYLAAADSGHVGAAPRMKELRYARKQRWLSYAELNDHAQREAKESALNPDRPETFAGDAERGLHNATGWVLQGFIEDADGQLRPQTYEETVFCMGCHGGLSATEDSVFAFARKLNSPAHGYFPLHWGEGPAVPDPLREDGSPEYATYLQLNHTGDSYRSNDELRARFFTAGEARPEAFEALAQDVRTLLLPSADRALALDKAYWLIVREQSFRAGREPVLEPAAWVRREVDADLPTGISRPATAPRLLIRAQPSEAQSSMLQRF